MNYYLVPIFGVKGAAILAITSSFLVVLAYFYLVHDVIFEALKSPVSYTHLTLPTIISVCRSRWSPYH